MDRLRVLFISHSAQLMGAELSLVELLENLDLNSLEPLVLVPGKGPLSQELDRLGVRWLKQPLPWWMGRRNWPPVFAFRLCIAVWRRRAVTHLFMTIKPDVVYTNSLVTPMGAWVAKSLGIPHIWHVRELPEGNSSLRTPLSLALIYRCVNAWSTLVACNSQAVARQLRSHGVRASVLHNPVKAPDRGELSSEFAASCRPRMLVVGTISGPKGQEVAIRALPHLSEGSLHLVGAGSSRYVERLSNLANALGVGERVHFYGHQAAVGSFFEGADLVIVPSAAEAFGRTVVEAMLWGRQVLGSDSGALVDLLPDEARFRVGDPLALAAGVRRLAGADPSETVLRARAEILARHDPTSVGSYVTGVIREVSFG